MLVEQAASAKRNVHRLEIVRTYSVAKPVVAVSARIHLELYAIGLEISAQRQLAGERCARNPGNLAYSIEGLTEEPRPRAVDVESVTSLLHLHGEYVGRIESGIDREQALQAAQQQSGTHH